MVIKKPYAFLIRHFKIIHFILALLTLFLAIKTSAILGFFNDYVKNGFYTYTANLSSGFINFYMFLALILILVLALFVYLLMKWKKKSRLLYISIIIFYIILFVGFLVYFNVFNTILNEPMDVRTVRMYRDIILILSLPQYFFLGYCAIRAIGFDVKKFDFKKDLAELDIAEEDQEEIEVVIQDNSYKYKRTLRRLLREFRYYVLENKFYITIIATPLCLILCLVIYLKFFVYDKTYNESDFFNVDGVIFRVVDSYITNLDLGGNFINSHKKYVVIKVSMENTNDVKVILSPDSLRLKLDKDDYFPIYSKSNYFKDLGETYYKDTLYVGDLYEYLIVYEIPFDKTFNKAIFRMIDSFDVLEGEITTKYKDVTLDLEESVGIEEEKNYFVGDAIDLSDTTLKKSEVIVNSYEIKDSFTENFEYCVNKNCYTGKKLIKADALGSYERVILKLDMETVIDDNIYMKKYIKNNADFISNFAKLTYFIDQDEKSVPINVKTLEGITTNNVYLEVPKEILKTNTIRLYLGIRNKKYVINLIK